MINGMAWQMRAGLTQEEVDLALEYYRSKYDREPGKVYASARDWPPKDPVEAAPNVHVASGSLLVAHADEGVT